MADQAKQLYLGKHREQWVRYAFKGIIASTTPSGRFLILRTGYLTFEQRSRAAFKALADFEFTSAEMRWVWDRLARFVNRREKGLHSEFERQYALERRAGGQSASAAVDQDLRDSRIHVDTTHGTIVH